MSLLKFDYQYDNAGNRTEVAEADGSRVTWSYDDTYQLTAEHRTGCHWFYQCRCAFISEKPFRGRY